MKQVVIISYYWPPSGGSGVQRWLYFARFLASFGHRVTVITVDPKYASYKTLNPKLVDLTKDVEVILTRTLEPLKLYSFLKSGSTSKDIPLGHLGEGDTSFFGKVSSFIRNNFFVPDARKGWNRYAFRALKKHLTNHKTDVVVTTGPPHSTHLVGLKMKQHFPNQKWVADFRDPWKEAFYEEHVERVSWAHQKNLKYEQQVIEKCDYLLTVGPGLQKLLVHKKLKEPQKIGYVLNGYDATKMNAIVPNKRPGFTLSFVGTVVDDKMIFDPILSGIEQVASKYNSVFHVEMAGNITEKTIAMFSNKPCITFTNHGYVSHNKALEIMISSNIVFTALAKTKHDGLIISGKLLEYFSSGRPTLVVGNKDGDVANLSASLTHATVIAHNEEDAAAQFIEKIFLAYQNGVELKNDISEMEKFSRKATAKQLEKLLSSLDE